MRTVYVPVTDIGIGWRKQNRWVEVTDARSGERHRVPDRRSVLVGSVLCVPGRSLGVEDGLHCVKIAGIPAVWVRLLVEDEASPLAA